MKNATTTATKTPRTPMNRAERRAKARQADLIARDTARGEALLTEAAKVSGYDIATPTKGKTASAQARLLGATFKGDGQNALAAIVDIRAARMAPEQVERSNRGLAGRLAAAGLRFDPKALASEVEHVARLFHTVTLAIADLFDGEAKNVVLGAITRNDLRTNALRAYALGWDGDLIDNAFGTSWRKDLEALEG